PRRTAGGSGSRGRTRGPHLHRLRSRVGLDRRAVPRQFLAGRRRLPDLDTRRRVRQRRADERPQHARPVLLDRLGPDGGVRAHRPQGILFARGAGLEGGALGELAIVDVAPTLLYSLDLPVPDDLEGRVVSEAFTREFAASRPVRSCRASGEAYPAQDTPAQES